MCQKKPKNPFLKYIKQGCQIFILISPFFPYSRLIICFQCGMGPEKSYKSDKIQKHWKFFKNVKFKKKSWHPCCHFQSPRGQNLHSIVFLDPRLAHNPNFRTLGQKASPFWQKTDFFPFSKTGLPNYIFCIFIFSLNLSVICPYNWQWTLNFIGKLH